MVCRYTHVIGMGKFFALLSGESVKLSQEEVISILETNNTPVTKWTLIDRMLELEIDGVPDISRVAMMHFMCDEIFHTSKNVPQIIQEATEVQFSDYLKEEDSFCVRITRVNNAAPAKTTPMLERQLGNIIQQQSKSKAFQLRYCESPRFNRYKN